MCRTRRLGRRERRSIGPNLGAAWQESGAADRDWAAVFEMVPLWEAAAHRFAARRGRFRFRRRRRRHFDRGGSGPCRQVWNPFLELRRRRAANRRLRRGHGCRFRSDRWRFDRLRHRRNHRFFHGGNAAAGSTSRLIGRDARFGTGFSSGATTLVTGFARSRRRRRLARLFHQVFQMALLVRIEIAQLILDVVSRLLAQASKSAVSMFNSRARMYTRTFSRCGKRNSLSNPRLGLGNCSHVLDNLRLLIILPDLRLRKKCDHRERGKFVCGTPNSIADCKSQIAD